MGIPPLAHYTFSDTYNPAEYGFVVRNKYAVILLHLTKEDRNERVELEIIIQTVNP